jgi:hypothetical protein
MRRSAIWRNARQRAHCGKAEIGTIEPGRGDIIAVYGNPLFDIVALDRVEVVVKDGVAQGRRRGASGAAKRQRSAEMRHASVWLMFWPRARRAPPAPGAAGSDAILRGPTPESFAFTGRCASCHDSGKNGAHDRSLNRRTPSEEALA